MGLGPILTTSGVGGAISIATIANTVKQKQSVPSATTSIGVVSTVSTSTIQMYDSFGPGVEDDMYSRSIATSAYVEQLSDEELEELSMKMGILDFVEDNNVKTL